MSKEDRVYLSGLWKGRAENSPWSGAVRPQDIDKLIGALEKFRKTGAEFVVFTNNRDKGGDLSLSIGPKWQKDGGGGGGGREDDEPW